MVDEKKPVKKPKPCGFKFKVGRPTKYRKEYCQLLIDHLAEGLSYECFAALVDGDHQSVKRWEKAHDEFRTAKNIGLAKGRLFWEQLGRAAALGQIPGFNNTVFVFTMKNRFQWTDKAELRIEAKEDFQREFGLLRSVPRKELIKLAKKDAS